MKYIDWYCEKTQSKNTAKKTQDQKHSGFRYWKDLVTETQYYISDRITTESIKPEKKCLISI